MANPTHLAKLKESYAPFTAWLKKEKLQNPNVIINAGTPHWFDTETWEQIKEGIQSWNIWIDEQKQYNSEFIIDLSSANLKEAYLSDANLQGVNLNYSNLNSSFLQRVNLEDALLHKSIMSNANLHSASLRNAQMKHVRLENAILDSVDFQEANLQQAQLQGAKLRRANLQGAKLQHTNFNGANLTQANIKFTGVYGATFQDANLSFANLHYADLRNVNFENANLKHSNLFEANLQEANLVSTNLSYTKNIQFSDNKIQDAIITSTTSAPWLTLKKNYTSIMMFFHIIGVVAFFLPYLVNATIWRSLNLAQELNLVELVNGQGALTKCFSESCTKWHIWELLLGVRRNWTYATLSIILIIYNALRIFLTQQVSVLRDSEQTTGYTPPWQGKTTFLRYKFRQGESLFHGYKYLYVIHQLLQIIFVIALFAAIYHTGTWLLDIVELPSK